MEVIQHTLYVTTQGAYLHRDHLSLQVEIEKKIALSVPIHQVQSVALFGNVLVSPGALDLCVESGAPVSFLTEHGRLTARVDAPASGNVLLRREQFRQADRPEKCMAFGRNIVAGKIQNQRTLLARSARESDNDADRDVITRAIALLDRRLAGLELAATLDEVRGLEGEAAKEYFEAFTYMIRQQREHFLMSERNRRPPLDPLNALLSFSYAILVHDCASALMAAGLDPSVGFLHVDRPGRPSLALDLMEEFRPLVADRVVLALINRRQINPDGFIKLEGGAVEMTKETKKALLTTYSERKQEEVTHPVLEQKTRIGLLPFIQAKLLARTIRGELPGYPPCVLR